MDHNFRFFSNKDCKYFPCHQNIEDLNCLFCYCPLYFTDCQGNYKISKGVKDCSDCLIPHQPKNYDYIIKRLASEIEYRKENK